MRYIGSGTIFHWRAFTKKRRPKKGAAGFFYPSPKKRESTLISRGFAAFVSSHLYSMSSRLDTKRNSLTGFSHLWYFFSEICAAKKKKACRRIVSAIRRQNKKGGSLLGRASCVEQGLYVDLSSRALRLGGVLHALRLPHHIAGHRLELGLAASVACDFTRMTTLSNRRGPISTALAKAASFVTDSVRLTS